MAQWFYRADTFDWVPIRAKEAAAIESAYTEGKPTVPLTIGSQRYTINVSEMTQTNDKTNKVRFLRRKAPTGEVTVRAIVWEWEQTSGHYTPYDPKTSAAIEEAFAADRLTVRVPVQLHAHDCQDVVVHFGHMHQHPVEHPTSTRAIRRSEQALTRMGTLSPTVAPPPPATAVRARSKSPDKPAARKAHKAEAAGSLTSLSAMPTVGSPIPARADLSIGSWTIVRNTILALPAHRVPAGGSLAVAAFDMDDTLIRPKSTGAKGKGWATFAKGPTDWDWLNPAIPAALRELHEKGYLVVIVSNQGGVKDDVTKLSWLKQKILAIQDTAKVPITAVCALQEDENRKPGPLMWDVLTQAPGLYAGCTIDVARSVYVGDAAGRHGFTTLALREKDFSCSDRKFAFNVGCSFMTPEQFLGRPDAASFTWEDFGPDDLAALRAAKHSRTSYHKVDGGAEVVVMVGWPGSGKSTFFQTFLKPHGYVHANRDTLGTPEKVMKVAEEALKSGKPVCIDNTSPQAATRALYSALAKKYNVPARLFVMQTSRAVATHLNIARAVLGLAKRVPTIAYHTFNKAFEVPTAASDKGFDEIVPVPLVVDDAALKTLPKGAARFVLNCLLV